MVLIGGTNYAGEIKKIDLWYIKLFVAGPKCYADALFG
jgi:hypothetical protein